MPISSAVLPPRRSSCTGVNSGQIRCTAATAVRSWVPCGPVKSSLPLSGWAPPSVPRRRPAAGRGLTGGSATAGYAGRGGADTEDDAEYMGKADPFVCLRVRGAGPAPASHPGECGAGAGWRVPT
ncbi:hypothetical protein SBRY_130113 [Actinacidiphila bryophytorum]|uniref:Uncharacterized protein n=1 Tax=Actinacidiphila bryophytorum TaxID=1436133 RepID=A0A9W4EDC7_9ACTN|nr:hypothetical protein SBRY_130113 [Actinacidiphila bryophytorum]